jgi:hypothetical protein
MRRSTIHHIMPTSLLVASTMLLAGCFTLESTFTISDHGTVDLELTSIIDTERLAELADLFGQDFADLGDLGGQELLDELSEGEDPCGELTDSALNYEVTTREISDGTMVGVSCTVLDVPIEDLTDLGTDSFLTIEQDESGTRFELILEGADELTGGGGEDITALLGIELDELFVVRFEASAPGSLSDSNATSTDGATATWILTTDASFVSNGDATLTASWVSSTSGSSSAVWIVAAIVAALLAVGVAIFLITKRSKSTGAQSAEPLAPPPASGSPGASVTATPPPPPPNSPDPTTPPTTPPIAPPPSPPSPMPPPSEE